MKSKAAITLVEVASLSWLIYRFAWPATYPVAVMIAAQLLRIAIEVAHAKPAPPWADVVGPGL